MITYKTAEKIVVTLVWFLLAVAHLSVAMAGVYFIEGIGGVLGIGLGVVILIGSFLSTVFFFTVFFARVSKR